MAPVAVRGWGGLWSADVSGTRVAFHAAADWWLEAPELGGAVPVAEGWFTAKKRLMSPRGDVVLHSLDLWSQSGTYLVRMGR